jgi:ribosomal protein S27AE
MAFDPKGAWWSGWRRITSSTGWRTALTLPTRRVLKPRPAWTRQIDEAVACATTEGAANSAEARNWLARQLKARREYWASRRPVDPWTVRGVLLGLSIASAFVAGLIFLSTPFTSIFGLVAFAVVGISSFALCIVTFVVFTSDKSERAFRRYANLCPKCGDGLLGTPSAIDPSLLKGVKIGPRTCPKCGCAWPLVFPPIPAEERTTAFVRRGP